MYFFRKKQYYDEAFLKLSSIFEHFVRYTNCHKGTNVVGINNRVKNNYTKGNKNRSKIKCAFLRMFQTFSLF